MLIQKNYRAHANEHHPENYMRIERIINEFGKRVLEEPHPLAMCEKHVQEVHPQSYVDRIKSMSKTSMVGFGDNPFYDDTYDAAVSAVGVALKSVDRRTFAAIRPPGHHAYPERFEGFCYFNNIAIAVKYAQSEKGYGKVAIIDIDAHYGNGTHWIFKDDKNVFYTSVHADPLRYYPGVKHESDNSFLVDVEPNAVDDEKMLDTVRELLHKVQQFNPSLIAVSAGFDSYYKDPLMSYNIRKVSTYEEIGRLIQQLGVPAFAVLEGGYSEDLGLLVHAFYNGLYTE